MAVSLPELARDPYPILHRLREENPVAWIPTLGMWFITRRDDVLAVLRDTERFRTDSVRSPIFSTFGSQMLSAEGETHRRYKSACAPPFNARAVHERAEPIVREITRNLLETADSEGRFDLRARLAAPLALRTVARILGFSEAMEETLRGWYDAFAEALADYEAVAVTRSRGVLAAESFAAVVRPRLGEMREDDLSLLSHLARQSPRMLDDDEVVSNALIVLFGGIETTEAAISNAAWALLTHPEAQDIALGGEESLALAIEESLRWEPAVQTCTRYAAADTTLRGATIREGNVVQCMIGAANRDPAAFPDPDTFRADRANAGEHLSFGSGRHFCLGAALARVEARVAIGAFFDRFPSARLDPAVDSRPFGHEFRKPKALVVEARVSTP